MTHLPQLQRDLAAIADRLVADSDAEAVAVPASTAPDRVLSDQPARRSSRGSGRRHDPRAGHRRFVRPLAAASLLAAMVVAAVLAVGVSGPSRLDVVAEARAALAPRGDILHVVMRVESGAYERSGKRIAEAPGVQDHSRIEQWSVDAPPRWKMIETRVPKKTPAAQELARKGQFATVEVAYGAGAQTHWSHDRRTAFKTTGFSDQGIAAEPLGAALGQTARSVEDIRQLLAQGRLRDDGETTFRGRTVRRLVQVGGFDPDGRRSDLLVDPTTFFPVRIDSRLRPGSRTGGPAAAGSLEFRSIIDFEVYERLPDTPENAPLLEIRPPAGVALETKTLRRAQAERRAEDRRRGVRRPPAKKR